MDGALKYALDAAKEITAARMENTNMAPTKDGGKAVADFYEEIFRKVLSLATEGKG